MPEPLADVPANTVVLVAAVVFAAAVIRGYAGFGLSAFVVSTLTLVIPPIQVVPLVLMLEIAGGVYLLPSVWRQIDWRQLCWILLGAGIATPIGIKILSELPPGPMRLVISVSIVVVALLIASGRTLAVGQKVPVVFVGGLVSGVLNGAAGIGGLPLVALFLSNKTTGSTMRATLAAYFVLTDGYAIAVASAHGLVTSEVFTLAAVALIPLGVGIALGNRGYARSDAQTFRRSALLLLIALGSIGILRELA